MMNVDEFSDLSTPCVRCGKDRLPSQHAEKTSLWNERQTDRQTARDRDRKTQIQTDRVRQRDRGRDREE